MRDHPKRLLEEEEPEKRVAVERLRAAWDRQRRLAVNGRPRAAIAFGLACRRPAPRTVALASDALGSFFIDVSSFESLACPGS